MSDEAQCPSPLAGEGVRRSLTDEGSLGVLPRARVRRASIAQARAFRRRATDTERVLWKLLLDRRLEGIKFRRQVPLGRYVVDFLCLRHRLVVEADGPLHDSVHDAARDAWLAMQGFRVMRFSNNDICSRDWQVFRAFLQAVRAQSADPQA